MLTQKVWYLPFHFPFLTVRQSSFPNDAYETPGCPRVSQRLPLRIDWQPCPYCGRVRRALAVDRIEHRSVHVGEGASVVDVGLYGIYVRTLPRIPL